MNARLKWALTTVPLQEWPTSTRLDPFCELVDGGPHSFEESTWIHEGKITWKETIEHGIENAPTAFLKLFKGENFGKMLVKLR